MDVRRPRWWVYPLECANGHPWGPGRVLVGWLACHCGPARRARPRGGGHRTIVCRVAGCRSVFYEPPHDPSHDEPRRLAPYLAGPLNWPGP